ncbi:MAG: hypothetical protein AABW68_02705 [archaeon]|mgnify:CR=1 FL=1
MINRKTESKNTISYLKVLGGTLFIAYMGVLLLGLFYGLDIADAAKEVGKGLIIGLPPGAAVLFIDREFKKR